MTTAARPLLALVLLVSACGTKVIDLVVPDDGGTSGLPQADALPAMKCETVTRADGSTCKLCYSAEGMVISSDCSGSGGVDAAGPNPVIAPEMCKPVPTGDTRCLICVSSAGMTMPCLKCDPPVKTSDGGDFCRACSWSDQMGRCLQCFTAGGMVTHDDCDMLRK